MTDEKAQKPRKPVITLRSVILCCYIAGYAVLRYYGEVDHQRVEVRGGDAVAQHIVGAPQSVPRWRRQLYRAFFGPLMVVEEEGRVAFDGVTEYGRGYLP